jgi:hypothetical protein
MPMKATTFDALARILANRLPRRRALHQGGAALVAGAGWASAQRRVTAQATPTADEDEETGSDLFVQTFSAGTLTPDPDGSGVSTLSLEGSLGQTVYFSDRPARRVGLIPTAVLLEQLGFTPADPPNAALVAQTAEGEDILVIELMNPRFDEAAETLAYDVRLLADYTGTGLADLAERQADDQFASSFTAAHLFIDGCGKGQCWDGAVSMCVSCKCFKKGVEGCPCVSGTRKPCHDPKMQCETTPSTKHKKRSQTGTTGSCWYP